MLGKRGCNPLNIAMIMVMVILLLGAGKSSPDPSPAEKKEQMTLRMVQLARAGRIDEARDVVKNYLNNNPTDGTMFYNLACLDLLLKEKDQAFDDLQRALENGYSNFRLLQTDTDLDGLRDHPRFTEMWTSFEDKFLEVFQDRALYLEEGYAQDGIILQASNSEISVSSMEAPQISAEFDKDTLKISVVVNDPDYAAEAPPWESGCGILINLIQPLSPEDYESRYYYSYGFFERQGVPEATLVCKHGKILLQPAPGLSPKITRQGDTTIYETSIPWEYFAPYAPPLDQELGLNVFYFGAGKRADRPIFSLMGEKRASFEADPWRRYIPINLLPSDRSAPVLRGRFNDRLCEGTQLGLQLGHWSASEGEATFIFSVHPQNDPSKTMIAPIIERYDCEMELNFFNFSLDVSELPEGSFLLRTTLTSPAGIEYVEELPFDNFEADYLSSLNERIHKLQTAEQSILKYHLFKLTSEIENRLGQDNAAGFHSKYAALVRMIDLCEAGSSCLPDQGLFQGGFSSALMTQRRCAMYLPKGYKGMEKPQLLVVLPPSPGSENQWAQNLGRALEGRAEVIVLVPQSQGYSSLARGAAADITAKAITWAQNLFQSSAVTLVGLGTGCDAALETSLRRPDLIEAILLDADQIYKDMDEFSGLKIDETLASRKNQIPYTLASSNPSSPRLEIFSASMENHGFLAETVVMDANGVNSAWLASWYLSSR